MKRIIFCFDGTWSQVSDENQTNVLLMASSIIPQTHDGITQIVHYDSGVGTTARDRLSGGLTGYGLFDNIVQAYQFLMFNYQPGDQIYVFGFSRGAFTARSFLGFIRTVGIIERHHMRHIDEAVRLYKINEGDAPFENKHGVERLDLLDFRMKHSSHISVCWEDDDYRSKVLPGYVAGQAHPFTARYVGLWDTVETLGLFKVIWQHLPVLSRKPYTGKDHKYHKHRLAGMLVGGRHAIALDERRRNFDVEPWGDIDHYNEKFGFSPDDPEKPFQEKFFPGTHGSVGGGGEHRGLSDETLDWIRLGALKAELEFDISPTSVLYQTRPVFTDPIDNNFDPQKKGIKVRLSKLRRRWRRFRPGKLADVSDFAQKRWAFPGNLPEGKYEPETLHHLRDVLDRLPASERIERNYERGFIRQEPVKLRAEYYLVQKNDTLASVAEEYNVDATNILKANPVMRGDENNLYPGQVLRVPLKKGFVDPEAKNFVS